MNSYKENKRSDFFENTFKLLFVTFWSIFLLSDVILVDNTIPAILFTIYNFILMLYIISYLTSIFYFKMHIEKIIVYYKLSTLLAFLFTSYSFFLFPTNIFLFVLKLIFIAIYMYFSIIKVYRYKMDEGVVGIMSSTLILVILVCAG